MPLKCRKYRFVDLCAVQRSWVNTARLNLRSNSFCASRVDAKGVLNAALSSSIVSSSSLVLVAAAGCVVFVQHAVRQRWRVQHCDGLWACCEPCSIREGGRLSGGQPADPQAPVVDRPPPVVIGRSHGSIVLYSSIAWAAGQLSVAVTAVQAGNSQWMLLIVRVCSCMLWHKYKRSG